jgi:mono/diheme cytochrome c family protein
MRFGLVLALLGVAMLGNAAAQEPAEVDFAREVQPVLAKHCFQCHGPSDAESGLRLSSREAALRPADSGLAAIVPGDASRAS